MKKLILISLVLLFASVITPAQQIQKSDAVNFILHEILATGVGKVDISVFKNAIPQTEGLQLCFNEKIQCPYPSNWVFFIDDNVFANWGHPCRYIFINTANKEFKIVNNTAPPSDTAGWESISMVKRPVTKLFKATIHHNAIVQSVTQNPHCYAVIINGGWNPSKNFPRYWNDISAVYCTLTQVYGYPADHIYVHSTDGTAVNNQGSLDLNNDGINEIKYPAYLSSIQSTFQTLAGIMQPSDQLFIYVADHGNIDNSGNAYIALWGQIMYPSDLNNMLSGINASEMIIVLSECFSGGFITNPINITGPHRIIQTACSANESSYPEWWVSGFYDEFPFYWTAAVRGYYPELDGFPWNTSYATGSFPFAQYFGNTSPTHPNDYNPDLNGDGIVEMQEAFAYADNFDTDSPYGYYNPCPGCPGYENPLQYNNIGFQEDLLSLTGLSGNMSINQTVSGNFLFRGNLTIPYSTYPMLIISPSSSFYFQNGASLVSNGNLLASGNSASTPITFNFFTPNSTTQNGIKFNPGSSGNISYCKILNACNGIYENGVNVSVSNSAISYCTNGLYLYGSNPSIYNNNIHNNTYGIYLLSSSPNIYDNFIQNNTAQGINCSASSNPAVGNGSGAGNNFNQNNYGVFCWNNSAPNLGYNSTGYNDLTNTNYNVYNMSSNGIYAMNNYWGDTNPTNFKIAGISSVVITGYKSSSQYVPTPPLNKTSSNIYASDTVSIPLLSELDKANQYIASNNLVQARVICLNLINNFPDNCVSFNALNLLKETFPANQIDSVKNLYKSIFNRNIKKKINAIAGLVLAEIDTVNRLFLLDNVISSYARDSVLELALFDKFICYYFDKSDKQNALSVLTKLDNMFPLSQGDIEAHQILGDENYYGMDVNKKQTLPNSAVQTITGYTLNDNYPNPFNPSTIISWQLAAGSFVTLKVYDVLGKEVKTLVNERQEAGTHSISFDGSTLSSGVYFYQLRAGSFLWTKKMLLTK